LQQQLDAYREEALTVPRRKAASNNETMIKIQELQARIEELEKVST
jgi:hypothetical protein